VCTQITATPWPPSATSTAAVHAPPLPGPTCRTRAPHPLQRNVRFNFFISSGGRQMNYCSALSRNNAKNPPLHNNQSVACHASHVPPPPAPMPRTRASYPWRRGVRSNWFNSTDVGRSAYFFILVRNKAKTPTHTTINRCLVLLAMSLPRPVRRIDTARHILGDAASDRIGSIRGGGGVQYTFLSIAQNNAKNNHHTTINRRLVLPAMSLPHLVQRIEPAHRILGDAVSA
jgi:hypothetical protein